MQLVAQFVEAVVMGARELDYVAALGTLRCRISLILPQRFCAAGGFWLTFSRKGALRLPTVEPDL